MLEARKPMAERRPYVQQWRWWIGTILVIGAALMDFVSFAMAPQTLVAPTGALSPVSNVFFAHFWLGEKLTRRDLVGTFFVIVGAIVVLSFGAHKEDEYTLDQLKALYVRTPMIWYICVTLGLLIMMTLVISRAEWILTRAARRNDQKAGEGEAAAANERTSLLASSKTPLRRVQSEVLGGGDDAEKKEQVRRASVAGASARGEDVEGVGGLSIRAPGSERWNVLKDGGNGNENEANKEEWEPSNVTERALEAGGRVLDELVKGMEAARRTGVDIGRRGVDTMDVVAHLAIPRGGRTTGPSRVHRRRAGSAGSAFGGNPAAVGPGEGANRGGLLASLLEDEYDEEEENERTRLYGDDEERGGGGGGSGKHRKKRRRRQRAGSDVSRSGGLDTPRRRKRATTELMPLFLSEINPVIALAAPVVDNRRSSHTSSSSSSHRRRSQNAIPTKHASSTYGAAAATASTTGAAGAVVGASAPRAPLSVDGGANAELGQDEQALVDDSTPTPKKSRLPKVRLGWNKKSAAERLELVQRALKRPPASYAPYARVHAIFYGALAGVIGAQTVLFAKSVAEIMEVTISGKNQFKYGLTYVILGCMVVTILLQQHNLASGLQLFDALLIVPVFSACFMAVSIISGGIYFEEFNGFSVLQASLFPVGVVLTLTGVYILSERRKVDHSRLRGDDEDYEDDDDEDDDGQNSRSSSPRSVGSNGPYQSPVVIPSQNSILTDRPLTPTEEDDDDDDGEKKHNDRTRLLA